MKKKAENKAKRLCLGEGEAIGHKHIIESKQDIIYEKEELAIRFMLKEMGVLTHDEHDRMVFNAGSYHSYNQVEFNPLDETVTRVFD